MKLFKRLLTSKNRLLNILLGLTLLWPSFGVPLAYADTKPDLWPYAERSLLAHLLKLEAEGRARREGERWRRA